MNTVLWIAQVFLAALFLTTGSMKLLLSRERLIEKTGSWPEDFSQGFLKLIACAEILGAIGLVVPWWTSIAPALTPLAAAGLTVIVVGATTTHVKRNEFLNVVANIVIVATAVFVVWGRGLS